MVRFRRGARLNTSRIRDRRGAGVAIGGGVGTLVLVLVYALTGVDLSAVVPGLGAAPADAPARDDGLATCDSVSDIDEQPECRFVAFENSIQSFWAQRFDAGGSEYAPASFTVFSGAVSTACGTASSQVGPFYCPPDRGVYLDLGFFDQLSSRLGATGGDFAEAYVVAHEFAHHVQNITGQMERVRTRQGADSDAVALELQADCLAGVWAHHATRTAGPDGAPLITEISDADIAEAIDAAAAVGDDVIQERLRGTVTPETWTHGSSEQRMAWFRTGLDTGDPAACDTFAP